ncbi:MAG TPA: class I SAM-dependent rRNA methyltransferase [Candidatus Sulfopaludibacter sp.]|nr:class I SAM-dependent rRNA methyltransferase [Candidatus Sulfopaludibacter sp.]
MPKPPGRESPRKNQVTRKAGAPAGRPVRSTSQTAEHGPKQRRPPAPEPIDPATAGLVRVSRRAADRLRAGHVWVYRSDVEAWPEGELPAGLLPVADRTGRLLGTGLYSPASEIALRLVAQEQIGEPEWLEILRTRLRAAIERRQPMLEEDNDACRLVFSEADEVPGITVDRYAGLVIVQLRHKALDTGAVRGVLTGVLRETVDPETILEREDPRIRELEQLSVPASATLFARDPEKPVTNAIFRLNGLRFHFDATSGQKTGAFLDQRENYAAAARYAKGDALDVCTYQGGFAIHLARVCPRVTGVDVSRAALEVAEKNLVENRPALGDAEVDWVEADAFSLLRDWSDAGSVYDTIVLDPPAFAKSKRAVEGALRGYRELNLRAFKMLRPGGRLVTCSCSHHVGLGDFMDTLRAAAGDAGRRVRLLEVRGAAPDHPVVLNIPETEYLKCVICEAE